MLGNIVIDNTIRIIVISNNREFFLVINGE